MQNSLNESPGLAMNVRSQMEKSRAAARPRRNTQSVETRMCEDPCAPFLQKERPSRAHSLACAYQPRACASLLSPPLSETSHGDFSAEYFYRVLLMRIRNHDEAIPRYQSSLIIVASFSESPFT